MQICFKTFPQDKAKISVQELNNVTVHLPYFNNSMTEPTKLYNK